MAATSIDISYESDRCVVTVRGDVDEAEAGALGDTALCCLEGVDRPPTVLLVDLGGARDHQLAPPERWASSARSNT